jgi:hypothetical protein
MAVELECTDEAVMDFINGFINSGLKGLVKGLVLGLAVSLTALAIAALTAGAVPGTFGAGVYGIATAVLAPSAGGVALSGVFVATVATVYGAIDGMIGGVNAARYAEIRNAYAARTAARGMGLSAERAPQVALAEEMALDEAPARATKKPEWLSSMAHKDQASFADRAQASMLYEESRTIH